MQRGGLSEAAESVVVALAAAGDRAAFSELVWRRQSWLRNLLRRLSRDPALADDLAQQVFLKAWRSLGQLKSPGAFAGWLRRLAINTWLAEVRAAPPPAAPFDPEELAATAAFVPSAAEELDLDRALARLPPQERLCVVLAYDEGLSHGEISAVTALPLGTVKSHVRRGAGRLRALLDAYEPPAKEHAHAG
ncbi:MAG TPA: sigma-70 family RNA polymerase sigma factor [Steroidobacteraceae bacterium]|nr:sigma-70 family RNA polymerase sigma factor [Gammaproteobacteria bacterium]HEV2284503.1 sigma-70 family RNA polymerase sigma factor [Steroidobacteraceae bacterium]